MKFKKYIIAIITALILISQCNIGVSKSNMENDARKAHKIKDEWITASCINDDFGAFLFYDEDLSKHNFSIYNKRNGFSFGYFFTVGGGMPDISENIGIFKYDGKGSIFLSLNKINVAKIEVDNGSQQLEVISINPEKPFSIIIPEDAREIRIYDMDGNLLPF